MRRVIASLNAKACATKRGQSPGGATDVEFRHFVHQKKIAGRNVNSKEDSILNTPEFCLDNGEYLMEVISVVYQK